MASEEKPTTGSPLMLRHLESCPESARGLQNQAQNARHCVLFPNPPSARRREHRFAISRRRQTGFRANPARRVDESTGCGAVSGGRQPAKKRQTLGRFSPTPAGRPCFATLSAQVPTARRRPGVSAKRGQHVDESTVFKSAGSFQETAKSRKNSSDVLKIFAMGFKSGLGTVAPAEVILACCRDHVFYSVPGPGRALKRPSGPTTGQRLP